MSKRHQASRRRTYGRRQHEMHERTERPSGPRLDRRVDLLPGRATAGRPRLARVARRLAERTGHRLMAVYEGARPRSTLFPRRRLEAPLLRPQAPAIPAASAVARRSPLQARPRFFGIAIGVIVVAFLLSFFSLVQTVRSRPPATTWTS
jgi:hypothetical protein